RWTDQRATVRFWVDQAADADLQLVGVAYPFDQKLTILVNGKPAADLPMSKDWAPYDIFLPANLFDPEAINTITLAHDKVISAHDATEGVSLDPRPLAAAYQSFELAWR